MQSVYTAKENIAGDTPLLLFDCTLADGTLYHWSSQTVAWNGLTYEGRVLKHNLFEAQMASDSNVGGAPKLTFELANADSLLSEIEAETGFKGSSVLVQTVFFDLSAGAATSDSVAVFKGLMNPPDLITESSFRLSAMNRMSMQRNVVPEVSVQRMCPWHFPANTAQRLEAVNGGERGKYSPFYRCGYSSDQTGGAGNLNGTVPFATCAHTRGDCELRGMFAQDTNGNPTARFGGLEFVPPTILVRGAGQKNSQVSSVQSNIAAYNNRVPLVYGTQWTQPDVVFSRNDGNLTRMEVLIGMGEIDGILAVLVDGVEIPLGVNGVNMTSSGWYNVVSAGARNGGQDLNFTDSGGAPQGDPYGSMAYLAVVVPSRVNNGTSIPVVQVLVRGIRLLQFDSNGNSLGESFSANPAWVLLDVLRRSGYGLNEINTTSFAFAAAYADQLLTVDDPVGGTVQLPRFECNFAMKYPDSAGDVIRQIRNSSRMYLVLNAAGLVEVRGENTFALQQPVLPAGSNSVELFNGGWPAYEFDATSIARAKDGSSSLKLSSKGAQDTPNQLTVEFQDRFNQFQQDSLSISDEDDELLCSQTIASTWDAVGISSFNQATRMMLLGINRAIQGNLFIEFDTSVKALGLMPGDLITVTYLKENLERTPCRIMRITPGGSFRTVTIKAQLHDDAWYSDTVNGVVGGLGRHTGTGSGLPSPVTGTVPDSNGVLQLGITEAEVADGNGATQVQLTVAFTGPSGKIGTLPAPLLDLETTVNSTGGTLAGGATYFYAISTVDSDGGESLLSFIAQATTPADIATCSVVLGGIGLPAGAAGFNVYRGAAPGFLQRISSGVTPANTFTDTGFADQAVLPPDPNFDHVNIDWRWELLPEAQAGIHSSTTIGNSILQLLVNGYTGALVRITRGTGAGQELAIASNTATEITTVVPWTNAPDDTSYFVIAENSWRFGASGPASPISIYVPERIGSGLEVSARAANTADDEAVYSLSPLTRWVLGQSGGLAADSDVPPAPVFGIALSPTLGGTLDLGAAAFTDLVNTRSIVAGTYTFHYYDEINGAAAGALTAAVLAADNIITFGSTYAAGTLLQIEQEIVQVTGPDTGGGLDVVRGVHSTTPADHAITAAVYQLDMKVLIVPFIKGFFGSPASGDWKYSVQLPNVRLASIELYMTNSFGNGAVTTNPYTGTIDSGLRTMAGGQYSFQVGGYLAIQNGAAPALIVDADRSVRDMYGIVGTPSSGAGITVQLNRNATAYATIAFADGAATSTTPVSGFGMAALRAGDILTLDITGVGTTIPGSDLTVIIRL